MRFWTALRWSRGWLFFAVALAFGMYLASGLDTVASEYGPAVLGNWGLALRGIVPVVTLAAAWRSRELAVFMGLSVERPRPRWKPLASYLLMTTPVLLGGLGAYLLGLVLFAAQHDALPRALLSSTSMPMHATFMATVVGWFCVGVAVGRFLPQFIGPPAIFAVSFLWLNWLPAIEPPWTHQLAGTLSGCCSIESVPHPDAIVTALALAAVGTATVFTLVIRRRSHAAVAVISVLVLGGVAVAGFASTNSASNLYTMVAPRADEPVCSAGDPTVCVWPEHEADLARVQTLVTESYSQLCSVGLFECPTRISVNSGSLAGFSYHPTNEDWRVIYNLSVALVFDAAPAEDQCAFETAPEEWHYATERLAFLAALHAGAPLNELQSAYGYARSFEDAAQISAQSEAQQWATMASDLAIIESCGTP